MSLQRQINTGDDDFIQCHEISSTTLVLQPFIPRYNFSNPIRCRRPVRCALYFLPRMLQEPDINPPQAVVHDNSVNRRVNQTSGLSTRDSVISVVIIFLLSLLALFLVYSRFPNVTEEERRHIKIPWNVQDAKQLGIVLNRYKTDHYYDVMAGVFVTYVFLQTFAIPGSLFLSILSGFLFPFSVALTLVCSCSALGASLCFLLSQLLGRKLVLKYFPERAKKWADQVENHKDNITNYMIFLRVTPFLPNWFINLTAPIIGVPLVPFALGTFIGVAPPSFIAIQGGQTLQTMTEKDSAFETSSLVWLIFFGFVSLLPIFIKSKYFKTEKTD